MEGTIDPFDFILAAELGMTVAEMHARVGNVEYHAWHSFMVWRRAMQDLAAKEPE